MPVTYDTASAQPSTRNSRLTSFSRGRPPDSNARDQPNAASASDDPSTSEIAERHALRE
jgi:hypothetical protein